MTETGRFSIHDENIASGPSSAESKGMRDRPDDAALSMGFDAARRCIHRIDVKEMSAQDFADLVVRLGYSFESILRD